MQTTFQDNAQDDSGCRRVDSSSDDCATPTKHDARKRVAAASSWDFTVTDWSRPFTPRCARGTTHNEWPGHNNASNTGWSAARRNRDYDSDKRDDGKTLDTDERDEDKTSQGRDGRTWRCGSDRWDSLNTMTNTHREYESWSSDDIWSAQTKTPDPCNKNTHGEAAAGQSTGNWWAHNAQEWHAENSQVKRSESSDTKTAEKLDATDDQAPAVLEELPDTTGNDTNVVRESGVDAFAGLVTDVKAAEAAAEVSREEGCEGMKQGMMESNKQPNKQSDKTANPTTKHTNMHTHKTTKTGNATRQ